MSDFSMEVALIWARANVSGRCDPIDFGRNAALAYNACKATWRNAGNEKATTAALAAKLTQEQTGAAVHGIFTAMQEAQISAETAAEVRESMAGRFMRSAGFSDRGPSGPSPHSPDAEDPESETTGKPNPPRPPCSPDAAVHNMPAAPSGPCDCGAQIKLVLESIKHALVMHGNCWITDVPEHPRVESLGWMTEFTREIKAIDDALLFLDETGRKHREYRRCSTDLLTEPQAGPSKCEQEHSGSRTPSEDCL